MLPASDFSPPPKVSSAIMVLETVRPINSDAQNYYAAVRALFSQPRKTLTNNLAKATEQKGDFVSKKLTEIFNSKTIFLHSTTLSSDDGKLASADNIDKYWSNDVSIGNLTMTATEIRLSPTRYNNSTAKLPRYKATASVAKDGHRVRMVSDIQSQRVIRYI